MHMLLVRLQKPHTARGGEGWNPIITCLLEYLGADFVELESAPSWQNLLRLHGQLHRKGYGYTEGETYTETSCLDGYSCVRGKKPTNGRDEYLPLRLWGMLLVQD